jgi:hypothetical protein
MHLKFKFILADVFTRKTCLPNSWNPRVPRNTDWIPIKFRLQNSNFTTRLMKETFLNFLRGSLKSFALNRILLENLKIVQPAFSGNNTCHGDGSRFESGYVGWCSSWFTSDPPGRFGASSWLWGESFRPKSSKTINHNHHAMNTI